MLYGFWLISLKERVLTLRNGCVRKGYSGSYMRIYSFQYGNYRQIGENILNSMYTRCKFFTIINN